MNCSDRVALVSPVKNGIRVTALVGSINFQTGRYSPPAAHEWQRYLDAGWTLQPIPEPTP